MFIRFLRAIAFIISLVLLAGIFAMPTFAKSDLNSIPTVPSAILKTDLSSPSPDLRSRALKIYLGEYRSPLAQYADTFIAVADKYQLDWRLLPAISGTESTFAKFYVQDSYNAYGWGGGYIYFDSWEDSIEQISASLKQNYINRGAQSVEQIARIYAPPSRTWASHVHHFMAEMDKAYQIQSALYPTL